MVSFVSCAETHTAKVKIGSTTFASPALGGSMKHSSSVRNGVVAMLIAVVALLIPPATLATPTVQLAPSVSSPQPVGTLVTWTATASDTDPGTLMYSFQVGVSGQ